MPNKTLGALLREGESCLGAKDVPDALFDARNLLAKCVGCSLSQLRIHAADTADETVQTAFFDLLSRRAAGEPLQYILGEWDFYDLSFSVREGVLIPRPETEFLAQSAIRMLPRGGVLYDVCAGSGCIGISVAAHRPDVQVYLFEKFPTPLETERENVRLNGVANVQVVPCDMFCGAPAELPAPDGIVSNPPYIRSDEIAGLQREVRREPRHALDGGEDGLLFFRALRDIWFPLLCSDGFLTAECGEGQPRKVASLFPDTRIDLDFTGTERFVTAYHA